MTPRDFNTPGLSHIYSLKIKSKMKLDDFLKMLERLNIANYEIWYTVECTKGSHMVETLESTDETIIRFFVEELKIFQYTKRKDFDKTFYFISFF